MSESAGEGSRATLDVEYRRGTKLVHDRLVAVEVTPVVVDEVVEHRKPRISENRIRHPHMIVLRGRAPTPAFREASASSIRQDVLVDASGTVHAIHGYLGVGKTAFARRLEAETGGVLLSIDEWTIRLSGGHKHLDAALFENTWALLSELWPRIVRTGADVILDFGFWSRESRDDARARAATVGAPLRLYSLQCSRETAIARCQARRQEHAYDLDADAYDALRWKFEPLGVDEAAEIADTED